MAQELLVELIRIDHPHRQVEAGARRQLVGLALGLRAGGLGRSDDQEVDPVAKDGLAQVGGRGEAADGRVAGVRPVLADPAHDGVAADVCRRQLGGEIAREAGRADDAPP